MSAKTVAMPDAVIANAPPQDRSTRLPYWDSYLRQLARVGLPADHAALHSHYGCWDNSAWSPRRPEDYARAAERTCEHVFELARIERGSRVLDVGCGMGSVLVSLGQRDETLQLIGLNIDPRQLQIARQVLAGQASQPVTLLLGDACQIPLADRSVDIVLALECSMHFLSREQFLREVRRVLSPGGRLVICEHFARSDRRPPCDRPRHSRLWGTFQEPLSLAQYHSLAGRWGLRPLASRDISRWTLPTFPGVRKFVCGGLPVWLRWQAWLMLVWTECCVRRGWLTYQIAAFQADA